MTDDELDEDGFGAPKEAGYFTIVSGVPGDDFEGRSRVMARDLYRAAQADAEAEDSAKVVTGTDLPITSQPRTPVFEDWQVLDQGSPVSPGSPSSGATGTQIPMTWCMDWEAVWATLTVEGLVGNRLALQQGDEGPLLSQLLGAMESQVGVPERDWLLSRLTGAIGDAVHVESLTNRRRGLHLPLHSQSLGDAVEVSKRPKLEPEVVAAPFVPKPGKRMQPTVLRRLGVIESAQEEEDRELGEVVAEILVIILAADCPVARMASQSMDPGRLARGMFGNTRASTLRLYLRAWRALEGWLKLEHGITWPEQAVQVADYLHIAVQAPCARSHPQTLLQALAWFEKAAGFQGEALISHSPLIPRTVDFCIGQLSAGMEPIKQAPRYPIVMLAALEIYVCTTTHSRCKRYRAFTMLLKAYASLRQDDSQHLVPGELRMVDISLVGTLLQTKTTGPTKRVKEVPFTVSMHASITEAPWLATGLRMMREPDIRDRKYLLPEARPGWNSFGPRMAKYAAAAAAAKAVLKELRVPVRQEWLEQQADFIPWVEGDNYLVDPRLLDFWTEHSARAVMPSILGSLQVDKSLKDLLGRWSPTGSEDYTRTFRSTVAELQGMAIQAIRCCDRRLNESDIWDRIRRFRSTRPDYAQGDEIALEAGLRHMSYAFCEQLKQVPFLPEQPAPEKCPAPSEAVSEAPGKVGRIGLAEGVGSELYLICYSKGRKFARLHLKSSACPWVRYKLSDSVELSNPCPTQYNARCKICWPKLLQPEDSDANESSASDIE